MRAGVLPARLLAYDAGMDAATIPLFAKLAYTAFMLVLVPVYLRYYGPSNFLYFCDVALLLTWAGVWVYIGLTTT